MRTSAKILVMILGCVGIWCGAKAQTPPTTSATNSAVVEVTPQFISTLAEEMEKKHPALLTARARTNAAGEAVKAVRTWEDPMIRIGGVIADEEMRSEDGDLSYGAEQRLPVFGKPKRARRVAQAGFEVEAATAEYTFQMLRRDLALAAFRAALAGEVVEIGREDLAWLETMSQTVEQRYRAGQATLVEALTIQNERGRRANQLQTDMDRRAHELFSLNRMLARDPQSSWPVLRLPALAGPVHYNERLVNFAMTYEPKLAVIKQQIRAAEAETEATRRQRWPDINAGVEARNYTKTGEFRQGMVFLSMNIPWFNDGKYRSEIRRDETRAHAMRLEQTDYQFALREEVHGLVQKIDAARREALLYEREIIPRSQSALESARAAWESGRGMFRDMLEARRTVLESRLMQARAVAEQYESLSELVLCCGLGDLEALQMIGAAPNNAGSEKPNE